MRYLRLYLFKVFLILALLLLSFYGCSGKKIVIPSDVNYDLAMLIDDLKTIKSVEAVMEVEYEKGDTSFGGDMYVRADENSITVRVYYLGFIAGEIIEENGVIKTNKLKISRKRAEMLVNAFKKSIFWWRFDFNEIIKTEDSYYLRSEGREVVIDSKRMLPVSQRIVLDDGDAIDITYSEPLPLEQENQTIKPTDWYQSTVQIEYQRYKINAKITSLKLLRH